MPTSLGDSIAVEDVLDSFVAQFYDDKPVPRLILLSHAIANQKGRARVSWPKRFPRALNAQALKFTTRTPERGTKSALVDHALGNAREALARWRKMAETASQTRLLSELANRFELEGSPRRIEVYDNSHISGSNAVGGMIVSGPEGFVKNAYRKFNIKSDDLTAGDDYAMMREVLTRRFKRLAEAESAATSPPDGPPRDGPQPASNTPTTATEPSTNEENSNHHFPERPDLVLIDGGAGHISVAQDVLAELGLSDIPLVGVAKGPNRDAGREHFHRPNQSSAFMLPGRDPVLYFVQRLRDEAHRFAIGSHRAKRSKSISANPLDDIGGIGPTRKRALMKHSRVRQSSVARRCQRSQHCARHLSRTWRAKFMTFSMSRVGSSTRSRAEWIYARRHTTALFAETSTTIASTPSQIHVKMIMVVAIKFWAEHGRKRIARTAMQIAQETPLCGVPIPTRFHRDRAAVGERETATHQVR